MKILKTLPLTLFLLAACSDFVETPNPQGKTVFTNFYINESQVFQGLVAAYDPISYTLIGGYCSTVMLGEIRSDNANAGGDPTNFDQPGWQEIDDLKATPLTIEAESFWQKNYTGLNKANQVLNNVTIQSSVIDQYQAEAKFLRALYHFELVRMFGPMPVITKALDPSDRNIKRATLSQVYTQIEKDLLEAIPLLPISYSESFAGRATKGAAQALLGKAYLYWADLLNDDKALFDKAAEQLNIVIASDQYELVDDYKSLFAFGAANTIESVFEIQYTNQVGADFGTYYPFVNGNRIVQLCGIRGLCSTHPNYIDGWGFMLPTQNLYDSYLSDDIYRRDASIVSRTALQTGGCSVSQSDQNPTDLEDFWQIKYANYKNYTAPNGGDVKVLKDANQPYIRYADVLLMYAEALVRGNGSAAEALTYIDQVRERAKGPGNNTGNFKTGAVLMAEKGWSTLDLIWYERRAEFAIEGDRWFDLVRSGRAKAELFEAGNLRNANFSEEDLYLPIPQREVDITGGLLTVYPDASLFQ
jgi:hypothetical protein